MLTACANHSVVSENMKKTTLCQESAGETESYCTTLVPLCDLYDAQWENQGQSALGSPSSSLSPAATFKDGSIASLSANKSNRTCAELSMNSSSDGYGKQHLKTSFSRSSMFCTSLYVSSSSSSETRNRHGYPPFLPHPSLTKQLSYDERQSKKLVEESSNLSVECTGDGSYGTNCASEDVEATEQLELQFLSDQLDIAINGNGENPRIDDIYETPQDSLRSNSELTSDQPHASCPTPLHSLPCQISTDSAVHKPRMRWTQELHECFMEAVNKLEGPEKATPKGVLKLMNVEGLTIYHVKSHLQKFRLAKYIPEIKEERKASSSEEQKSASSSSNESNGKRRCSIQVSEALRMQMEVQKQLHEQLEVQKELQLRIEEHARYLQKILDEQMKAGIEIVLPKSLSEPIDAQMVPNLDKHEPVEDIIQQEPSPKRIRSKEKKESL